jgi:hypothetical protein
MASYTATSATTRGSVTVTGTPVPSPSPSWLDEARDNVNLILPSPTVNTDFDGAVEASWIQPSPAADYTAVCSRYFAAFPTTGVPTQATSIQLYVHTRTSADNDLRIVKASAPGTATNINAANYKAIPGILDGTGMAGLVTDYYNGVVTTPSIGWNAIPLNATAISDFNSQPELRIAIVDSTYDYNYTEPTAPSIQRTGISAGVTSGPYLLVDTGINQWVLSINPSVTSKVNPVPTANIKLVNRV